MSITASRRSLVFVALLLLGLMPGAARAAEPEAPRLRGGARAAEAATETTEVAAAVTAGEEANATAFLDALLLEDAEEASAAEAGEVNTTAHVDTYSLEAAEEALAAEVDSDSNATESLGAVDLNGTGIEEATGQSTVYDAFCLQRVVRGRYCLGNTLVTCKHRRAVHRQRCSWDARCRPSRGAIKDASCGAGNFFCRRRGLPGEYCDGNVRVTCKFSQVRRRQPCPPLQWCRESRNALGRISYCLR